MKSRSAQRVFYRCASHATIAGTLALLSLLSACGEDRRVVRYNAPFAGLEGASGGAPPIDAVDARETAAKNDGQPAAEKNTIDMTEEDLRITKPDGKVTLVSRTIRHMMVHFAQTLAQEEDDLLYEQVVSQATKQQFSGEGRDTRAEILLFLKNNQRDILALFGRMPGAERSPNVVMKSVGKGQFRLSLSGPASVGMKFTTLWVTNEAGVWRLLWIT